MRFLAIVHDHLIRVVAMRSPGVWISIEEALLHMPVGFLKGDIYAALSLLGAAPQRCLSRSLPAVCSPCRVSCSESGRLLRG